MDDDLIFGTSVWGITDTLDLGPPQTKSSTFSESSEDPFDDFDDPVETTHTGTADDDFGDFGDFGQVEATGSSGFEEFGTAMSLAGPSEWFPLKVDPLPSRQELTEQLNEILQPIWGDAEASSIFMDEGIREVEGVSQILVTPERCPFSPRTIAVKDSSGLSAVIYIECLYSHHRRNRLIGRDLEYVANILSLSVSL